MKIHDPCFLDLSKSILTWTLKWSTLGGNLICTNRVISKTVSNMMGSYHWLAQPALTTNGGWLKSKLNNSANNNKQTITVRSWMAFGISLWFFQNEKSDKNNFVSWRNMKVILHYLNNGDYNYKHFLSENWNIFSVILSKDQIETAAQINSWTKAKRWDSSWIQR